MPKSHSTMRLTTTVARTARPSLDKGEIDCRNCMEIASRVGNTKSNTNCAPSAIRGGDSPHAGCPCWFHSKEMHEFSTADGVRCSVGSGLHKEPARVPKSHGPLH